MKKGIALCLLTAIPFPVFITHHLASPLTLLPKHLLPERCSLLSPKTGEDHLTQALLQQKPASVLLEDSAEYRSRRTKSVSLDHFPLPSPHL